ncbi:MAG: hypothetical protein E6417_41075, partial [Bradyrhizobium sp.]|nr:hypothetical protein [Bradyrhizobium sp.]
HHGDNALSHIALDTSIGVSARCDFTSAASPFVRASQGHAAAKPRPSLPAPRVVTIARNAPSE